MILCDVAITAAGSIIWEYMKISPTRIFELKVQAMLEVNNKSN